MILLSLSLNLANEPTLNDALGSDSLGKDVEKIQSLVEDGVEVYNPGTGEFNRDALDSYFPKTKFEETIDEFNSMFDKANNSWAPIVFGMKIELSLVFILNLYFILLFLVTFVFNVKKIFYMFDFNNLVFYLFGSCLFLIFVFTGLNLVFARIFTELIILTWTKILPIGLIVGIVFAIILTLLFLYAPQILLMITKRLNSIKERVSKKRNEKKYNKNMEKSVEIANDEIGNIKEISNKITDVFDDK